MKHGGYSNTITAVCRDCNGEGRITIPGQHIGHGRYEEDTYETCSTCKGHGLVEVTKTVSFKIQPKVACANQKQPTPAN